MSHRLTGLLRQVTMRFVYFEPPMRREFAARLPARLQRVSPRPKRAAAVNHLARFGAHARALQPRLQATTPCATAPPLVGGVLQGSERTVQASRARCAHRRSLAC